MAVHTVLFVYLASAVFVLENWLTPAVYLESKKPVGKIMIHSLINDYLIRLKNASLAEKAEVVSPFSNHIKDIAGLLQKYGFIKEFKVEENKIITQVNSINQVKLFSTPGRKIYTKATQIPYGADKKSLIIISTSRGVMGQKEAVKAHLGGQLIAELN